MVGMYPVFIPKLLAREEFFVSGRRSCRGCGKALAIRMVQKVLGKGLASADGERPFAPFSLSGYAGVGVVWDELTTGGLTASLVERYSGNDRESEKKKVVIGIDRRVFLKDPLALTGVLEGERECIVICYDSEQYMDELIKRTLPSFPEKGGNHPIDRDELIHLVRNKGIPPQVGERKLSYIATTCPSYPLDLMEKVRKGLNCRGAAFISVLAPCPTGWIFIPEATVQVGLRAVRTGFYPLLEVEEGAFKLTEPLTQLRPLKEYFQVQQRYIPFPPELLALLQEVVTEEYEKLRKRGGGR